MSDLSSQDNYRLLTHSRQRGAVAVLKSILVRTEFVISSSVKLAKGRFYFQMLGAKC